MGEAYKKCLPAIRLLPVVREEMVAELASKDAGSLFLLFRRLCSSQRPLNSSALYRNVSDGWPV